MLKRILGLFVPLSAAAALAACSNMTAYERQVQDWEPVYCYKSIGAVQCYKEPKHSDSRRLVNFYGPAPGTYDEPEEPEKSKTLPPEMIETWVKDPEPVPQAAPDKDHAQKQAPAHEETKARIDLRPEPEPEDKEVSFMDKLMRFLSGKPQLSNQPVKAANASAPKAIETVAEPVASATIQLQPAPAAYPVIPVQSGTL